MTGAATRRFAIRYSLQRWSDGKWFYGSFFIVLVVLVVINLIQRQQIVSFIPVLVLDGAILLAFWLMRLVSYVEITDDGLRVRYLLRHVELPYSALARVRRQPLEVAFQPAERRRFVNRFVRRLAHEPAAYIRLDRRQADLIESTERQLGPRLVAGADIVVPIVDVDEFIAEIKGRLRGQTS
jgi:Bacterial PH domain